MKIESTASAGTTLRAPGRAAETVNALTEQVNNLQSRYYRSLAPDCELRTGADYWYLASIASFCIMLIFPPFLLVAAYCVIKAKKGGSK